MAPRDRKSTIIIIMSFISFILLRIIIGSIPLSENENYILSRDK